MIKKILDHFHRHKWIVLDEKLDEYGRQLCQCTTCSKVTRMRFPAHNCHTYF